MKNDYTESTAAKLYYQKNREQIIKRTLAYYYANRQQILARKRAKYYASVVRKRTED